jgi:hypothetical protein
MHRGALDRERLQRAGTGRRLDGAGQRPERALGTPHHLACVRRRRAPHAMALQASIVGYPSLAQGGEEVAAAVGHSEWLARDLEGELDRVEHVVLCLPLDLGGRRACGRWMRLLESSAADCVRLTRS